MNSSLPFWLERVLGIETGPGEGTTWSLTHTWNWAPWFTLLFAVFAVAFVVAVYLRESPQAPRLLRAFLAAIRLALVALVVVMLAQFALSLERTGLPYVALILDDSLSMTIADRYEPTFRARLEERVKRIGAGEANRWNLARELLLRDDARLLRRLGRDYKLRLYLLAANEAGARSSQASEIESLVNELASLQPGAESSRLGSALQTVLEDLRGSAPAALVLLSDGVNTDGPNLAEAASYARRRGVPVFTIGLGDEKPVQDLKLTDLLVEEVVFVNDVVGFEAKVAATGYPAREVRLVLRHAGQAEILAETKVTLGGDDQPQTVRLPYRPPEEGEFRFVLEVEPLPGELQTDNNRQERTLRVRKEQIRVLLVQGYPSYEFRFLREMLRRDSTIALDTVLQEADLEFAEKGATALRGFPVRKEELFKYDTVILADADPAQFSGAMLQNLADFVEDPGKGGSLALIAGPRYMPLGYRETPLARLMPFDLSSVRAPEIGQPIVDGFLVQPTETGLNSPPLQLGDTALETQQIWQSLPPLYWLLEIQQRKPAARVWAEHPERSDRQGNRLPVVLLQYVGAGKVLFHATDETWRWRRRVGDIYFARYWVQTIRYLARSKLAEGNGVVLTSDRPEYRRGDSVRLRVRFTDPRLAPAADDGVTVAVEHQGGKNQQLKLRRSAAERGVFETLIPRPAIGSYRARMAIPSVEGRIPAADFTVVAPPGEFARVEMDAAELKRVAEATKGRFYTYATAGRLLDDLPAGRQVPIESLPPRPLWNTWPVLVLFLLLLISEWTLRKLAGMA